MSDRITRTYWLRLPRWRSRYERPVNWRLFRLRDFVPLLAGFAVAAVTLRGSGWIAAVLAGFYFGVFPLLVLRRLSRRRRWCLDHHHVPYRPIPEVDEWECERCGMPLPVAPQRVATSVAYAASQADLARRRRQAFYSDRR